MPDELDETTDKRSSSVRYCIVNTMGSTRSNEAEDEELEFYLKLQICSLLTADCSEANALWYSVCGTWRLGSGGRGAGSESESKHVETPRWTSRLES